MKKLGRPPKPDSVRRRVAECIGRGMTVKLAAEACSVGEHTIYQWQRENPKFATLIKASRAKQADACLANIMRAARKDWHASAWLLERKFPDEFARLEARAFRDRLKFDQEEASKAKTKEELEQHKLEQLAKYRRLFNIAQNAERLSDNNGKEEPHAVTVQPAGSVAVAPVNGNGNGHN